MSLTGGQAVTSALLQLGVFDPGETPNTSEQNACLLVANQMLANWFQEQALAIQTLISEQDQAGNMFIDEQKRSTNPLVTAFVLAGGTYTPPSYSAGSYTAGSVPAFPDLTTSQTFPEGYDWAIVTGLAVALIPQYGSAVTASVQVLLQQYQAAKAQANPVPGRIPVPGAGMQGSVPPPTGSQTQTP